MYYNILLLIGSFRLPFLLLDWILVILIFELSIVFLIRHLKRNKHIKNHQNLAFFSLLVGFSLLNFLTLFQMYYINENMSFSFLFWNEIRINLIIQTFSVISIMSGSVAFFFLMELDQKIILSKFFLTTISLGLFIFYFVFFIFFIEVIFVVSLLLSIIFQFFFITTMIKYSLFLDSLILNLSLMKRLLPLSLFVYLLGSIISEDVFIPYFGYTLKLFGSLLEYLSFIVIAYYTLIIPPLQEVGWKSHIENIYLMNPYGACIFCKAYKFKDLLKEKHIVSGAITSINMMLSELSQTKQKGLSIIEKKNKFTYIYISDKLTGVLFSDEDFNTIKVKLEQFVKRVEEIYDKILDTWDGTLDIFLPIEAIANEFFD